MFTAICAFCFIYTVADVGASIYVVRKYGVQETRRRVAALFGR